jgi:hypothetical protein
MPSVDVYKLLFENFRIKFLQEFGYRMKDALQNEFKQDFLDTFSDEFDKNFSDLDSKMSKQGDPTAPSKIKPAVMNYVSTNFENGITFDAKTNEVKISLLSPEALGYPSGPDRHETDKVRLFYFYLEGAAGELAFINNTTYDIMNYKRSGSPVGRFGEGFLMDMKYYSAARRNPVYGKNLPSEEEVRFPLSGSGPVDIIGMVMNRLPMSKYINIATKKALEGIQNVG